MTDDDRIRELEDENGWLRDDLARRRDERDALESFVADLEHDLAESRRRHPTARSERR